MTNAPTLSSQAVAAQQPEFATPPANPMGLAIRLLVQLEQDLAHNNNERARIVNTALIELMRCVTPEQARQIERGIEELLRRIWGCCFR